MMLMNFRRFYHSENLKSTYISILKTSLLSIPLLICFFVMPAEIYAQEVTAPRFVATSYTDGATLGIPRWKGYMSETDPNQFWLSYANSSSSLGNINYTTDGGENWSSNVIQVDATGWLDFHLSLFGKDNELYFTWPGVSSILFRKFNTPAHSNNDRESIRTIQSISHMHRSNVMVDANDRIWVFTRLYNNPSQNVRYHYSDNNGATWTDGVAYATNNQTVRIGSMPYVNGQAALIVYYMDNSRGYEYYLWNGSSFEAKPDHSIYPQMMNQVRTFTHNVVNDTTMHLIFGYGNDLHHVWKHYNNGTGGWNHQTIDYSANILINDWFPSATVKGDDLYLFYCKKSTGSEATSMIYYKKWSQTTETWTNPVMISTDPANTYNRDPNTCFQVPDNAEYIPVFWRCGTNPYSIYFSKIILEAQPSDTIPPGQIIDLRTP